LKYRRFGKTGLQIPVFSCGGMRYQQSWKSGDPISDESQRNLEATIRRSLALGINHIETARGYGTSEEQLGRILPTLPRDEMIIQTKVAPMSDVAKFEATFEKSMSLLKLDRIDLFAFHGINTFELIDDYLKCLPKVREWQEAGRIGSIGFSTHAPTEVIVKTIQTDELDYVNLHWYWIFQDNWPAIVEATKRDMGVFIISPNDKGGMLYKPPAKLVELCAPLNPMVFNGLFCLRRPEVHTLSCGASKPTDFDVHLETVELLERAEELLPPIIERLEGEMEKTLGRDWIDSWQQGLPEWDETPNEINIPVILRMRNLALAFDMVEYGKMRYNMLGNGGHWFPGNHAGAIDEVDLSGCLQASPHADQIPALLAEAHERLKGEEKKRLQAS
jgi:uncharacterized protein